MADFRIPRRDWNQTILKMEHKQWQILEYLGGIETIEKHEEEEDDDC